MQPEMARRRVEELNARLQHRKAELSAMKNVVSSTPVVIGGALVIPQGLLAQRKGETTSSVDAAARARVERIAMDAVIEAERSLGYQVTDVSAEKCGWDVTSRPPANPDGSIRPDRHIEVKGRAKGQNTITVSRNEIIYGLNQADKFILAIVIVDTGEGGNNAAGGGGMDETGADQTDNFEGPFYVKNPFQAEPDYGVASINYSLDELLAKSIKSAASL